MSSESSPKGRVLIGEDVRLIAFRMTKALEEAGYEVASAVDGESIHVRLHLHVDRRDRLGEESGLLDSRVLRERVREQVAQALHERVWPLLTSKKVGTIIYATFDLADAGKAHAMMEASQHIGKIMLKVRG